MNSLIDRINKLLDDFADLNTPGWDNYSAQPITPEMIERTKRFWAFVTEVLGEDIKAPHVFPCPSGGIQLEWERESVPPAALEIELFPDGRIEYLYAYGSKDVEGAVTPESGIEIMERFFAAEVLVQ